MGCLSPWEATSRSLGLPTADRDGEKEADQTCPRVPPAPSPVPESEGESSRVSRRAWVGQAVLPTCTGEVRTLRLCLGAPARAARLSLPPGGRPASWFSS